MHKPVEITYAMLASGNKRFINYITDSIIITILQLALTIAGNGLYEAYGYEGFFIGLPDFENIKYTLLGIGITIAYYGLFETLSMRTPGKHLTNTLVVNRDGTRPDNNLIFIRTLCRLIPLEQITFLMRPMMGLHDGLSKTLVVDVYEFEKGKRMQAEKNKQDNEENK